MVIVLARRTYLQCIGSGACRTASQWPHGYDQSASGPCCYHVVSLIRESKQQFTLSRADYWYFSFFMPVN